MAVRATLEMTPVQALNVLEQELGLSSDELAVALAVSSRTLDRWRRGETYPQREARQHLVQMIELRDRLNANFDTPTVGQSWLRRPHPYLGGLTPAEVIRAGRIDRAIGALDAFEAGIFI
jgi:uncharacterized protein (DUF2384 family)